MDKMIEIIEIKPLTLEELKYTTIINSEIRDARIKN